MLLLTLFQSPLFFIIVALSLIIAITFHEASHALVANFKGDSTAKDAGRLSLNPLSHLDVMGTIFLLLAGFGWGKPVPINHSRLKNPIMDELLIALAGPLSNLIVAGALALIYRLTQGIASPALSNFLLFAGYFNIMLMIFNLIPVPPLDGSKILNIFLPFKAQIFLNVYGMYLLLLLIFLPVGNTRLINIIIGAPINYLFKLFFSGASFY